MVGANNSSLAKSEVCSTPSMWTALSAGTGMKEARESRRQVAEQGDWCRRSGLGDEIAVSALRAPNRTRPNGPADSSPGLRPKADALGQEAIKNGGLKGRESSQSHT